MNRTASQILKVYLTDPGNRQKQLRAFGAFEQHLDDVAFEAGADVLTTNLTSHMDDIEVMLMWLVILNDDLRYEQNDDAVTLRDIRAYLNLIYRRINLSREEVLRSV